jgi:hypothetical protein
MLTITLPANPASSPTRHDAAPPAERETMTPFVRFERDAAISMEHRLVLLEQPSEFFARFCDGQVPSLEEKVRCVERLVQQLTSQHIYENNLYHVEIVYEMPFIHLDIRRLDGGACKNWRHFQRIKNELVGPEFEAMELFPAESRLVDTANQYHLWVHADPGFRFPLGYLERFVLDKPVLYQRYSVGPALPADSTAAHAA